MLKPSELKLDGKYIKLSAYEQLVRKKVNALPNKKLALVLNNLLDAESGDVINIKDLKENVISSYTLR